MNWVLPITVENSKQHLKHIVFSLISIGRVRGFQVCSAYSAKTKKILDIVPVSLYNEDIISVVFQRLFGELVLREVLEIAILGKIFP